MGRGSCPDVSGMQQLSWGPVEEHGVCTSSLGPAVSRKAHFITSSHHIVQEDREEGETQRNSFLTDAVFTKKGKTTTERAI